MKLLTIFGTCLLLALSFTQALAQKINTASPIDNISYTLSDDAGLVELVIELKLRVTEEEPSVDIGSFKILECRMKTVSDREGKLQQDEDRQTNSLIYRYRAQVLPQPGQDISGGRIRLQPDWKSFSFYVIYQYQENITQKSPTFNVFRSISGPRSVPVTIGTPEWFINRNVTIPISCKEDIRVRVVMKEGEREVATSGTEFVLVMMDKEKTFISLDSKPNSRIAPGTTYNIEVTSQRSDINLKNASMSWTAKLEAAYQIDDNNSPGLKKLNVNYGNEYYKFTALTTVPGTLSLVFDTNAGEGFPEIIEQKNSVNNHDFTLNFRNKPDGQYTFHFEGKSEVGARFLETDKKYTIVKDTITKPVGVTAIRVGESENFEIEYFLSRKIPNTVSLVDDVNVSFKGIEVPEKHGEDRFCYKVGINLPQARSSTPFKKALESKSDRTPVQFSIKGHAPDRQNEIISNFQIDVVKVDQNKLYNAFSEAKRLLDSNRDNEANTKIKEALDIKTEPSPESDEGKAIKFVFDNLKETNTTKRNKFFSALKILGKIAIAYFGIPITR